MRIVHDQPLDDDTLSQVSFTSAVGRPKQIHTKCLEFTRIEIDTVEWATSCSGIMGIQVAPSLVASISADKEEHQPNPCKPPRGTIPRIGYGDCGEAAGSGAPQALEPQ
jgi:hypothetical protein